MMHNMKKIIPMFLALFVVFRIALPPFAKAKRETNKNWRGLAIKGCDPVAYHTAGQPVKGSKDFQHEWKDAKWRFAAAENRDAFESDPGKYAPQYGGYCAWAVSQGYTADVDPETAWKIVNGKLYLNYSVKVQKDCSARRSSWHCLRSWPCSSASSTNYLPSMSTGNPISKSVTFEDAHNNKQ